MSYSVTLSDEEMEFLKQLFQSQVAITLQNVEIIADFKRKMANALRDLPPPEEIPTVGTGS